MQSHYEVLGVAENASKTEIKRAYRRLVKNYHPDTLPQAERPAAEARMGRINVAYGVLNDPDKRFQYDQERLWAGGGYRPPGGNGGRAGHHSPGNGRPSGHTQPPRAEQRTPPRESEADRQRRHQREQVVRNILLRYRLDVGTAERAYARDARWVERDYRARTRYLGPMPGAHDALWAEAAHIRGRQYAELRRILNEAIAEATRLRDQRLRNLGR